MKRFLPFLTALALSFVLASGAVAQDLSATINGAQEVPVVFTPATGIGCFFYDTSTNMLSFDISYSGLIGTETAAHFHGPANPGVNAGVTFALPGGQPKNGSVGPLSAQQESDLLNGLWYVNIHTNLYPGGEIRGQVLTGACEPVSTEAKTWGTLKTMFSAPL